ncbi:MAG: HlyD family efflux transporter periplasmic adaptor subunit [Candidatus Promineofilum sp.]|nr:HlyD family efflux transporter periplasmic adaptor subunit [Promineifilum sp.]
MTSRNVLLLLFLSLVTLTACNAAGDRLGRYPTADEPTPIPTAPAAAKPTYVVTRGDITARLSLAGRVSPIVEESLSFTIDGQIGELHVEQFTFVAAGDVLATLDTIQLDAARLTAKSEHDIAAARLAARAAEVERARRRAELQRDMAQLDHDFAVAQAGAAPSAAEQHAIDRLRLALELAQIDVEELDQAIDPALQAEVDAAALRLAQAEADLAAAQIVAPFDGVVLNVEKGVGRGVVAGETVLVLADLNELQASAGARDSELEQLAEDLPATVTAADGRGPALPGVVAHLPYPYGSGGAEESVEGDKTIHVAFDDQAAARAAFELGDRIAIDIVTATRQGALWLPPSAVREFSGRRFVVVESDGVQQRVDVVLGIAGDGRVEIVEGLSEGQVVVAP